MEYALSILAGDISLMVGPEVYKICRNISLQTTPCPDSAVATWLCKNHIFFTLFKIDATYLFCHANKIIYHASPLASLSQECPRFSAYLCQFALDELPSGPEPRLLVFDVMCDKTKEERCAVLRDHAAYLPQPLCTLQWVGLSEYLHKDFLAHLPHATEGLMHLTDDPCSVQVSR